MKHETVETDVACSTCEPGRRSTSSSTAVQSDENDSFSWAPVIRTKQGAGSAQQRLCNCGTRRTIFAGRLRRSWSAWEQLAQALLVSNEFVFVD